MKKGQRLALRYAATTVRRDKWKFWREDDDDDLQVWRAVLGASRPLPLKRSLFYSASVYLRAGE